MNFHPVHWSYSIYRYGQETVHFLCSKKLIFGNVPSTKTFQKVYWKWSLKVCFITKIFWNWGHLFITCIFYVNFLKTPNLHRLQKTFSQQSNHVFSCSVELFKYFCPSKEVFKVDFPPSSPKKGYSNLLIYHNLRGRLFRTSWILYQNNLFKFINIKSQLLHIYTFQSIRH